MTNRSRAAAIVFSTATLAAIAYAVYLSLDPTQQAQWVFDPMSVVLVCGVMALEATVAGAAIFVSRPRLLWIRCLVALAVLMPWTYLSTMFFVHAPGYVVFRHIWAWFLVLLLVILCISSAIRQYLTRTKASHSPASKGMVVEDERRSEG